MRVFIDVQINAKLSLAESLELERELMAATSPAAKELLSQLRSQNATLNRLAMGGHLTSEVPS